MGPRRSAQRRAGKDPARAGRAAFAVNAWRAAALRGLSGDVRDHAAVDVERSGAVIGYQLQFVGRAGRGLDRAGEIRRDHDLPRPINEPVDRGVAVERDRRGVEILQILAPEPDPDRTEIFFVSRIGEVGRIGHLDAPIATRHREIRIPPPGAAAHRRGQHQAFVGEGGNVVGLAPAGVGVLEIVVKQRFGRLLARRRTARRGAEHHETRKEDFCRHVQPLTAEA